MKEHCNKSAADHCDSYPFCWGCNAFTGNEEEIQKQLDEFFEKTPYKVTFDSDRLKHGKVFHENSIANVWYDSESDEVEVDYVSGEKERYKRTSLKLVEADEREIATEEDYLIEPNLHVIFYPEGWMSNYYIELYQGSQLSSLNDLGHSARRPRSFRQTTLVIRTNDLGHLELSSRTSIFTY